MKTLFKRIANITIRLSFMHVQSCLTLCDPVDCSPPGSSLHGIFQARILEQVVISYSKGPFQPRDQIHVSCISCIDRQILFHRTTWEAHKNDTAMWKTIRQFLKKLNVEYHSRYCIYPK